MCSLYALGLLGSNIFGWQIAYHEATFAFLFIFISGFEWQHARDSGEHAWARLGQRMPAAASILQARLSFIPAPLAPYLWLLALAALQAAVITAAVTYLFEQQFYVRLP